MARNEGRDLGPDRAAVLALLEERGVRRVSRELVLASALRDVTPCEEDVHSAVERVYEAFPVPVEHEACSEEIEVRDVPGPELPEGASDEAVEWFHSLTR